MGLGGCGMNQDPVPVSLPDVTVHCLFMDLPNDFLQQLGFDDEDPPVWSDIETFFLFQWEGGLKSKPLRFRSGEAIQLQHTSQHSRSDLWINANAAMVNGNLQLQFISCRDSPVQLRKDIRVELPEKGYSTLLATTNVPQDGQTTFVWVISAVDTEGMSNEDEPESDSEVYAITE